MLIDILEIMPVQRALKCDSFDCINCPHFKDITLNCSHEVYIECDLDEEDALKELEGQNMDSNYDVIQGDCPCCPFADLFGGFCFYYRLYPANIGYGEATCRCEELKPRED